MWAAGIAAASLALALATRGPALPDGAKARAAPQQLLSAGDKAGPLRAPAGALLRRRCLCRRSLLTTAAAAGAKASRGARRGFSSDAAVRALQAARALR